MSTKDNFEKKFEKTEGCWEWKAAKTRQGYGQFGYRGQMRGAHRVAYELYISLIPYGMQVLHICDNPSCVNPEHLRLGTNADNVEDRKLKGRSARLVGTDHHNSAFTKETLEELKKQYATGLYTHRELARIFKVGKTTVSYALAGKTYY